jgi:mannose-6-phosphate isomerase
MFRPILKDKIWGGKNLKKYIDIKGSRTGEAWLLVDQEGNNSEISNGPFKGLSLHEIMKSHAGNILGKKLNSKYGDKFPLLFKFLDTSDRISIQVHPDDRYAKKRGYEAGKTEMWYILQNKFRSSLLVGMKKPVNKKELELAAEKGGLEKKLVKYRPVKGDAFFIPAGTVHTIGKGNVIFEIQQNSDVTYRLYDWGRQNLKDDRHLNISDALGSIKNLPEAGRVKSGFRDHKSGIKIKELVDCPYFRVGELKVEKELKYWYNNRIPLVLAVLDGELDIVSKDGRTFRVTKGCVALIPYDMTGVLLRAKKKTGVIVTEVK